MLDGLRSWMKDILHKTRGRSEPHITPEPRPRPILKINSDLTVNAPARAVTEPRTPQISFSLPSLLHRSSGNRSLLLRYDADRTDASRSILTSPPTPTRPDTSDLRRTALRGAAIHKRAVADPNPPRRTTMPIGPPHWFPSGTISMTSRTTHQTYSADPSPLFTGTLRNDILSPATTVVTTHSKTSKSGQVLGNNVTVSRRQGITSVDPSLKEQTAPFLDKDPTKREAGVREFWIKVTAPSLSPQFPIVSDMAKDVVVPILSVMPPTPSNAHAVHVVETKFPVISDAVIVDSPEGSITRSCGSAHSSDSHKAVAFSNSERTSESRDGDIAIVPVPDREASHTTDIVNLVPHTDSTSIANVHHSDVEGVADAQNMQWQEWSFVSSSRAPTYIQYPSSPVIPLSDPLPHISEYTHEMGPTQTTEHVHPGSSTPSRDFDSRLERQLEGSLGSLSTPISQLSLVQPPPDKTPLARLDPSAHVNYIMTPSVNQGPYSVVGPNAPPFATDRLPPTEFVLDFQSCPRYPATSLIELLPFRRPGLYIPSPAYLSDDNEDWVTSDCVEIQTENLPPWPSLIHGSDDRPRRYTTLGMISKSPGKFEYLVYNRKSCRFPHTMVLLSPVVMDSVELQRRSSHLKLLLYLVDLPQIHINLAVYYDEGPVVWYCPEEFIWHLSPRECGTLDLWNGAVEEFQMPLIIRDLANGLDFLHHYGVIHGDLRAHNIIIDQGGYAKIGNFGRAIRMTYDEESRITLESRQRIDNLSPHTAPELVFNGVPREIYSFNHAIDIWALGMIVCELQLGRIKAELSFTLLDLQDAMVLFNAPPVLLHLIFEGLLVEDFQHRAIASGVTNCAYLSEAQRSGAPSFLNFEIPPLFPVTPLPAKVLDQHQHYMARRQARNQLERDLGFELCRDESFRVGRDC